MSISNTFLLIIFSFGVLHISVDAADLRCYYKSFENYTKVNLTNPESILNSSAYNSSRETVFCTHGFITDSTADAVKDIVEYYLRSNITVNICALDWKKEASGGLLGLVGYAEAVNNVIAIGDLFGKAVIKLNSTGLKIESIHSFIGFSLGAHLMGIAGRVVQTTGFNITRIVGLDPAGPLYQNFITYKRLDAGCATMVMALHTNPGGLGIAESIGTVDIWANCGNVAQPGCIAETLGLNVGCSHGRAYLYYTEALEIHSFIASAASSCLSWKMHEGSNKTITIEHDIDMSARGDYYLQTNSKSKYGRGINGTVYELELTL